MVVAAATTTTKAATTTTTTEVVVVVVVVAIERSDCSRLFSQEATWPPCAKTFSCSEPPDEHMEGLAPSWKTGELNLCQWFKPINPKHT